MAEDVTILAARFAVLGIVFLFLFTVLRTQWRELTRARPIRAGGTTQESALLYVVQPGKTGLRSGDPFELEPSTTIGRIEGNNVVLDEETVSSRHALSSFMTAAGGSVTSVPPTGPSSTTKPSMARTNRAGDLIQVGGVRLQFAASRPSRR